MKHCKIHILLVFLCLFFCLITSGAVFSQDAQDNLARLDSKSSRLSIGPYIYLTRDEDRQLSPQTLVSRHLNNLRGQKQNSNLVNLGFDRTPVWMIFTVFNQTRSEDWVLHFGQALEGRAGMAKRIYVLNSTTGKLFYETPSDQKTSANEPTQEFIGAAIPVKIATGTPNVFVVFLEKGGGFPLTVVPSLMTEKYFLNTLRHGDISSILAGFFLIFMFTVFTVMIYITRDKGFMFYMSYYAFIGFTFFIFNSIFTPQLPFLDHIALLLFSGAIASCCLITASVLGINYSNRPLEYIILLSCGGLTVFSSLLHLVVFEGNAAGYMAFAATVTISIVMVIGLLLVSQELTQQIRHYFAGGWFIFLAGFGLFSLSGLGLIAANPLFIDALWASLPLQAGCFVMASLKLRQYRADALEQALSRQKHSEQTVERLQKSKESADQARLLRVIERERELMSELREREIQRTEEMRVAKDTADKANQAKSAFLAVVSHEIRTPMTGILGVVQLLRDTNLSKSQSEYVDTIRKSGETMMALLNDILDFEKIERGSMVLEQVPFDLPQLAQDVVTLMSGHAAQKNLYLHSKVADNVPCVVKGDPTRLRQVLLNLVNNGLKFTQTGGVTIELTASVPKETPPHMNYLAIGFSVRDTGIGISEEAQAKLFTPFTQAEASTSRKYGGTGLGLAISARLIEAMKSKILVESQEGQGSNFHFDVVMEVMDEAWEEDRDPKASSLDGVRPMRILVTEDNEMNRKVLHDLLKRQNHTVFQAANGLEAIDVCHHEAPELIFMDIQMDGLDGLETTKRIRDDSDPVVANIPIIALTGNVMKSDIDSFFKAGMNGFLPKPIEHEKLYAVIMKAAAGIFDNPLRDKNVAKLSEASDASKNSSPAPVITKPPEPSKREIMKPLTTAPRETAQENSDDRSAIQKFIELQNSFGDTDKITVIDEKIFQGLVDALGKAQISSLLEGFLVKADEIVSQIEIAVESKNIAALAARGHELKGMAANFGMKEVSEIAGLVEKAAKTSQLESAIVHARRLPDANARTKEALKDWLS